MGLFMISTSLSYILPYHYTKESLVRKRPD